MNTQTSKEPITAQPEEQSVPAICLDNIAITGVGLKCITGNEAVALFGAVATGMGFAQPDPVLEAPALTGDGSNR